MIIQNSSAQKLGFNELTIGIDTRSGHFYKWTNIANQQFESTSQKAMYTGVSARFATSFLATCYNQKFSKWRIADVLIGEIGLGAAESNFINIKSGFFPTYDFTIGFGGIYRINEKQDIGINFGMLRFARSLQTKNFSGCNIYLKYRNNKWLLEAGIQSWYEFYVSWIYIFGSKPDPIELTASLKYFINDKKLIGIRAENNSIYSEKPHLTSFGKEFYWNIRLFYGIYF